MKNPPSAHGSHQHRGVALVLVLCFVVLITGLVVAYFSRALTTRQLSTASTSTAQAEMLANSASDVILSDFKQEIANGSVASTPPPAALPGGSTVYVPTRAANAVPQRNPSPTPAAGASPPPLGGAIPNLVRRSLRLDSAGGTNAAPSPAPTPGSRASAANSATASLNGRSVSPARWNRHYLIPANPPAGSSSASLTASTPVADFTAPDWVFVTAEKGPDLLQNSPFKDASGAAVTVSGRYAYAIYDEGGLLDINHTGYPSVSTPGHVGAKLAPSYADLTQLPLSAAVPTVMTTTNVDNLLGWRNYATLQATGTFPSLQPSTSQSDAAYFNLFTSNVAAPASTPTSNPPSILQVPLTVWNNRTDQMFLSRQQLIDYFAAANLDPRYLQYLGTFSRGLNQPSYLPDPIRPPVLPTASGGNDASGNTGITPNFLTARVVNTFQRFDGTHAVIGEPLVKKRFPLNRLAWLTYKGPSATRNTSATALSGADADIGYLKQNGITKEWLDQGTPENVLTYFGLQWDPTTKWTYSHGVNGNSGAILNINNAAKSTDVARQNPGREPDFFELLKAAINPGSIAKASLAPSVLNDSLSKTHAAQDQYKLDTSIDIAILQIGANIIDQFDTDGFPTQINYSNLGLAGLSGAVYGDENVPYISRVRSGLLHLVESNPVETTVDPGTAPNPGVDPTKPNQLIPVPNPVIDTGVAALMNYPEIWNLHDWSATNVAQSAGAIAPSNFKIYATTNTGDGVSDPTTVFVWDQLHNNSMDADVPKSPGFGDKYHFSWGIPGAANPQGGEPRLLSESNTKMTFSIDPTSPASEVLFREPTVLYSPTSPGNIQLAAPFLVSTNAGLGYLHLNPTFFGGGGLLSAANSSNAYNKTIPTKGAPYVGFYIGAHPLRWWDDNKANPYNPGQPTTGPKNSPVYQTQFGPVNDVIFTLACEDGNGGWITYDMKPSTTVGAPNASLQVATDSGFGFNGTPDLDFGLRYYQGVDPRSSRFGIVDPWVSTETNSIPPRKGFSANYWGKPQWTLKPDREGVNSGTGLNLGLLNGDPYNNDWFTSAMGWYHDSNLYGNDSFRVGLLTQNNPSVVSDGTIPTSALLDNSQASGPFYPFYYADADGVVRRASGGNVDKGGGTQPAPAATVTGLPMASVFGVQSPSSTNNYYSSGTAAAQSDSRPSILNRPFRSVAELGYVYSGTPWKNLDFFLPESGDAALLDVFCVNDDSDANAMAAGQTNLNTHQVPVLQAILAQAGKDQWNDANSIPGGVAAQAQQLAQLLVTRTVTGPTSGPNAGTGPQPLQNVSDLVGRWVKPVNVSSGFGGIDGKASCDGFATDLATFLDAASANANLPMHNIQRFGESAVRALANAGQTRVWNLMFDIVAQTGRFPSQATTLDQFNVEGEQRYWVHVAIDRYTGRILDKQVEVVKE